MAINNSIKGKENSTNNDNNVTDPNNLSPETIIISIKYTIGEYFMILVSNFTRCNPIFCYLNFIRLGPITY